jgi:hypothetical protein
MVLNISISSEAETKLKAKATLAGLDVEEFAARLLERLADIPATIEGISGAAMDAFQRSGMTEEELSSFLEVEKHQMRTERANRKDSLKK